MGELSEGRIISFATEFSYCAVSNSSWWTTTATATESATRKGTFETRATGSKVIIELISNKTIWINLIDLNCSEQTLDDFLDNLYSRRNPQSQLNQSRRRTRKN